MNARTLRTLGFARRGEGAIWRRGGLQFHPALAWPRLVLPNGSSFAAGEALGRPGLWRPLAGGELAFELPAALWNGDEDTPGHLVDWAQATAPGVVPAAWKAPCVALETRRLTVTRGPFSVQGQVVHAARRLALRFPLARVEPELGARRRMQLREMLTAAQGRWHLVRTGIDPASRAVAEVDLSGVPPGAADSVLEVSLAALRRVVAWLLAPVSILTDMRVESALLDRERGEMK